LSSAVGYCFSIAKRRVRPNRKIPVVHQFPFSEPLYGSARDIERMKLMVIRRQRTVALVADQRTVPQPGPGFLSVFSFRRARIRPTLFVSSFCFRFDLRVVAPSSRRAPRIATINAQN
jgi:hypothetical protein